MSTRVVTVTEFKANAPALLEKTERGTTVTITRRGRPVAVLEPVKKKRAKKLTGKDAWESLAGSWAGKLEIVGDIVNTDRSDLFDCLK
jgi:prevent-host-death family protein